MSAKTWNIAFFASHGGSNMQAIIDRLKLGDLPAKAALVLSNNSKSGAKQRAEAENIPFYHLSSVQYPNPDELDKAICDLLIEKQIDLIVLAGYMKKIGASTISKFGGRILNIHPALLPNFGGEGMYGMNVHNAVIEAKAKVSGPTVHVVDEYYDKGRILGQIEVPVLDEDTPDTLQARVLEKEHILYPEIVAKIVRGEIVL
jgi:phosphoribosylglycinamide formyltransferase-1